MHRSASGCTRQLQALQSWATLPPHVRNTSHSRCRRHRAESDSICLPCALSKKLCKLPNVHQQAVLQAPGKENAGASPDCHTTATVPQAKK